MNDNDKGELENRIEIIPAIMPEDFEELSAYARQFANSVSTVQLDVMDGRFVPPVSWPYGDGENSFDQLVSEQEGLPFWQKLDYEADLMISSTEDDLQKWIHTGVKRIIVHYEALENAGEFFKQEIFSGDVPREFLQFGIAIENDTNEEEIFPYIEAGKVDFVQCMGIAEIGYQGQSFDERVLPKIESLRKHSSGLIISVDGSVNAETAPRLVRAGATRLVAGSAILGALDLKEAIRDLKVAAESGLH